MPGFTLIRVSSQQSSWARRVQALRKWKNKSPEQSWLSSLIGEVELCLQLYIYCSLNLQGLWPFISKIQGSIFFLVCVAGSFHKVLQFTGTLSAFSCSHFCCTKNLFSHHCSCSDCGLRANFKYLEIMNGPESDVQLLTSLLMFRGCGHWYSSFFFMDMKVIFPEQNGALSLGTPDVAIYVVKL